MKYDELVKDIAESTGQTQAAVRAVLFAFPDALIQLDPGEEVRTPLGVFRMTIRQRRAVTLPDQRTMAEIPEAWIAKLKPGIKLRR